MAIRNKFAHIAEVDSFSSYLKTVKSARKQQNYLKEWFPNLEWKSLDIEVLHKTAYFLLTMHLNKVLFEIDINNAIEKGREDAKKEIYERFFTYVSERLKETEVGRKILKEAKDVLSKDIQD